MNVLMSRGFSSPRWPRALRAGFPPGLLAVTLCTLLAACVAIPVKAPRVKTPASGTIKGKVDLTFLKVGVTCQAEVHEKLGHLATGYETPGLFVARWLDSEWMFLWAAGAYYTGAAGSSRDWGAHTMFVSFDQNGVVSQIEVVSDKELLQTIRTRALASPRPDPDETFCVKLMHSHTWSIPNPGVMMLGKDGVELREEGKKKHDFQTPLANVEKIRFHGIYRVGPDPRPNEFVVTVSFHEKTRGGVFLLFHVDFPRLVALSRIASQHGLQFE